MSWKVEERADYMWVQFDRDLGGVDVPRLDETLKKMLTSGKKLVVMDFVAAKAVEAACYKPVVLFHQAAKRANISVASINLTDTLGHQLVSDGVDKVFGVRSSLEEAMKLAGITGRRLILDVNFVNPFIQGTVNTLQTQAKVESKATKPYLKGRETSKLEIDIAGIINLTSVAFRGSVAICFPKATFLKVYEGLLGEKATEISQEMEDAAGELLNIIFGQAKAFLNNRENYKIQKAIPTVVRGDNVRIHHLSRETALVLPFESSAGPFLLEISADPEV